MSKAARLSTAARNRLGHVEPSSSRDSVLVISNYGAFRLSLAVTLDTLGYHVVQDQLSPRAMRHLRPHTSRHQCVQPMDALVLDLSDDPLRGLALLAAIREVDQDLPVLVIGPAYEAKTYGELLAFDPAVVFEGPVAVEAVAATILNLADLRTDEVRLAG